MRRILILTAALLFGATAAHAQHTIYLGDPMVVLPDHPTKEQARRIRKMMLEDALRRQERDRRIDNFNQATGTLKQCNSDGCW